MINATCNSFIGNSGETIRNDNEYKGLCERHILYNISSFCYVPIFMKSHKAIKEMKKKTEAIDVEYFPRSYSIVLSTFKKSEQTVNCSHLY